MEILERGTPPAERSYVATCHNCLSKLRFFQREAVIHYDQREGDYISISCPVCSTSVTTDINGFERK